MRLIVPDHLNDFLVQKDINGDQLVLIPRKHKVPNLTLNIFIKLRKKSNKVILEEDEDEEVGADQGHDLLKGYTNDIAVPIRAHDSSILNTSEIDGPYSSEQAEGSATDLDVVSETDHDTEDTDSLRHSTDIQADISHQEEDIVTDGDSADVSLENSYKNTSSRRISFRQKELYRFRKLYDLLNKVLYHNIVQLYPC